jgi:broad specificity phosphatase PhoE
MRLGHALGAQPLIAVVSSPLARAVQTARPIAARAHCGVEIDTRLVDRDYGTSAGSPREVLVAQWGSVDNAPGVEPVAQVLERAWDALEAAARRAADGSLAIVAHDAVNRLLLVAADGGLGNPDELRQDTGCFNVLEYRNGGWTVLSVNSSPDGGAVDIDALDRSAPGENGESWGGGS